MSWKKLSSTTLLHHPRMTIVEDDIQLSDGRTSKYIYIANPHDSAMVLAVKNDLILIQTEYSYPPDEHMYQFPGGAIKTDEDPTTAGLRELSEESGYVTVDDSNISYLGYFYTNNRRSASKMHVILVNNPVETGQANPDPEEYIESEWIPISMLRTMIGDGIIVNYSILAGLSLFDNRIKSK